MRNHFSAKYGSHPRSDYPILSLSTVNRILELGANFQTSLRPDFSGYKPPGKGPTTVPHARWSASHKAKSAAGKEHSKELELCEMSGTAIEFHESLIVFSPKALFRMTVCVRRLFRLFKVLNVVDSSQEQF
jgi:hypothetical protein